MDVMERIKPGLKAELSTEVTYEKTAAAEGHTGVEVYSTPQMVGLMEMTCVKALHGLLPVGYQNVGLVSTLRHIAATPIGFTVTSKAELVEVDGRRLVFVAEIFDDLEKVGEGRHERMVVNWSRLLERLVAKKAAGPSRRGG